MFKRPSYISVLFILVAAVAGMISCDIIRGPDFELTPEIRFKQIDIDENATDQLGNRVDKLTIVLHFEDGDGDLGLTAEDRDNPPFQRLNPDGTINEFYFNYFARGFRKVNGTFVEINGGVPYSGAFPPLKPDGKPGPIEGDLEYTLSFPRLDTPPNDTLYFEVQIVDRALRKSNIVKTNQVVVNKR